MQIWGVDFGEVRQTDGFTCGPTSAMIAAALLDPAYAETIGTEAAAYGREQHRIHRASNRFWPRRLGTTPWGVAAAISRYSAAVGVRYGWRLFRAGSVPALTAAVDSGWPVAVLIGSAVPRHWVLVTGHPDPSTLHIFNPTSGRITAAAVDRLRSGDLPFTFRRPYAFVLPTARTPL